jgi:excisionase family DNA binding protein
MTVRDGWTTSGAWATSTEVAAYLSVEVSTVWGWARAGKLPATRLGSKYGPLRFRKLDIERWVTRQPRAAS